MADNSAEEPDSPHTSIEAQTLKHRPFYYLRHGQTDWNLADRVQGQQDVALNDTGRLQVKASIPKLKDRGIAKICCSPLGRARESAAIIAAALGVSITVIDDLKEAAWGGYEGQIKGEWFLRWKEGAMLEGVEPHADFLQRALRGINAALDLEQPVLIVAHGGTYWAVEQQTRIALNEDIANSTPLFHEPPTDHRHAWSVKAL